MTIVFIVNVSIIIAIAFFIAMYGDEFRFLCVKLALVFVRLAGILPGPKSCALLSDSTSWYCVAGSCFSDKLLTTKLLVTTFLRAVSFYFFVANILKYICTTVCLSFFASFFF